MTGFLCFAPHPDDAEIYCGGLLLKAARAGIPITIVDITRGELGTRGTPALRKKESAAADRMLPGVTRINLGLKDGGLANNDTLRVPMVRALRRFRPKVVLTPYWEDQHPDHEAVGRAAEHAAYLCGVPKYDPKSAQGVAGPGKLPYRPAKVLYYNNRYGIHADLVVDVSDVLEDKLALVRCYTSQFGPAKPKAKGKDLEPQTKLSSDSFFTWFRARHQWYGSQIGVAAGEAYCVKGPVGVGTVESLL